MGYPIGMQTKKIFMGLISDIKVTDKVDFFKKIR